MSAKKSSESGSFIGVFSIVASILGFVVDAITLISWFSSSSLSNGSIAPLSISGISIDLETVTLLVLIYTLLVFGVLTFMSQKFLYGAITIATIPLFLVWASLFHQLSPNWVIFGSFLWAQVYFAIMLTKWIPIYTRHPTTARDYIPGKGYPATVGEILTQGPSELLGHLVVVGLFITP
jgi:hypothetical protein